MHSSKIPVARSLTMVCVCVGGVLSPRGVYLLPGGRGVSAWGGGCLPRGVVSAGGGCVSCDLSHHAFDVTCMLPPHQLRLTSSAAAYILLVGHVTCKACWDTHPPLWTEFLTHAYENITLPQTSFAGGKNRKCNTWMLQNFWRSVELKLHFLTFD